MGRNRDRYIEVELEVEIDIERNYYYNKMEINGHTTIANVYIILRYK